MICPFLLWFSNHHVVQQRLCLSGKPSLPHRLTKNNVERSLEDMKTYEEEEELMNKAPFSLQAFYGLSMWPSGQTLHKDESSSSLSASKKTGFRVAKANNFESIPKPQSALLFFI